MKLRSRLLILVIIALCITVACCIFAASRTFERTLEVSTSTELVAQSHYLANEIPQLFQENDQLWNTGVMDTYLDRYATTLGVRLTIIDTNGNVRYDSQTAPDMMDNHIWREEVRQALEKGEGESSRRSDTLGATMFYHTVLIDIPGASEKMIIRIGSPLSGIKTWQRQFIQLLLPMLMILLACIVVITLLIIRHITKPIELLARTAQKYAAGDLTPRTLIDTPQELKQLSDTLNLMAQELALRIRQLEQDKLLYSSILLSMTEGVLLVDRKQTIVMANQAAVRMLLKDDMDESELQKIEPTQLIGKTIVQLFGDDDLMAAIERTADGEGPAQVTLVRYKHLHGETAMLIGSGRERTFHVSMAAISERQGEHSQAGEVVITFTDITDLKRLEQIRKDFVANVSHELKTPLTAIGGFSETLANEDIAPADAKRFSQIINRNAKQMQGIIDDLLLLASLENTHSSPTMERCSLTSLVEQTIENVQYKAEQKHMKLITAIDDPHQLGVLANQGLLVQALVNLAVNAITYSNEGSEVKLEAKVEEPLVTFSVTDQGCGIPERDLERIFERFYRVDKARSRSQGGTGLGLSIVKHVAVLHGGSVNVSSKEGVGSCFTIVLPREDVRIQAMREKSKEMYSSSLR